MSLISAMLNIDVRSVRFRGFLAALGLCCLVGCQPYGASTESSGAAKADGPLLERVTTGPVPKKNLQLFSLQPARVEPYEQTPILSKIAGYVDSVAVDLGDTVRKGDLLVLLRAAEYNDAVVTKQSLIDQASAQVLQAQAALIASQAAVNSASALVQQALAGIERAEAQLRRWESENARIAELAAKGSVTVKLADETSSQYLAALANKKQIAASVESEQAKLLESQSLVGKAKADLDAANAKLSVAKSEHAQSVTMLEYLKITAPFDGVVTSRGIDVGHYVQPAGSNNTHPLLTITNSNKVRIGVDIPESEAAYVDAGFSNPDLGDSVEILFPSNPGKRLVGRVTRTAASLDPQSRTLSTQIELDNSDRKLLSGAFVQVKVLLEEKKDVWALPIAAVVKKGDDTLCCLVVGGKVELRPIKLGLRVGDDVEVVSGLDGSEMMVLARAGGLKAGQSVEIPLKK